MRGLGVEGMARGNPGLLAVAVQPPVFGSSAWGGGGFCWGRAAGLGGSGWAILRPVPLSRHWDLYPSFLGAKHPRAPGVVYPALEARSPHEPSSQQRLSCVLPPSKDGKGEEQ